jgi:hypothetical protein
MGHNNFDPHYDEDEERISLVNVAAPITNNEVEYDKLELKSDSDSDDEKL